MEEVKYWTTSYALSASDLYYGFPHKKYMKIKATELPKEYNRSYIALYSRVFKYFWYLLINDIIENKVTFKFPPFGSVKTYIEMVPIHGEDFVRARQNGAFQDVEFLMSNFTGYQIYLRFVNRFGKWLKRVYVSSKYKDRITELTNKGHGW